MAIADVTIRGAGIFGLSIAWECLRRGARVQVVDPSGPGAGASGGLVGALAPHVPENWNAKKKFQRDSLFAAEAFWAGVAEAGGGDPGYGRTGRIQPLADEAAVILARARAETARELWLGRASWRVRQRSGDWEPPSASGWVVEDTLSARLAPLRAIEALVAAIVARGGVLVEAAPEKGPTVWATGAAGLTDLSAALGQSVGQGIKGQAALLALDLPEDAPQLFVEGLHVVPHADGTVAIGSTTERDPDDATGTDAALDAIVARARGAVPRLVGAPVIRRWAGLRPRARSRAPILGPWPGRPGHFVANGGFKIGFGVAPGVARVIADLVLDGRDAIPDGFRLDDTLRRQAVDSR